MASKQISRPMHLENTVLSIGKEDLSINNAFATYRDMKLDGVVSGSMSFIKSVLSKDYCLVPKAGSTTAQVKAVEAMNLSLGNMKSYDKRRLVNNFLQMLDYGCSLQEVVLERVDGFAVFKNISPIHLSTVERFEMDNGELKSVKIGAVENDGLIRQSSASKSIDGSKLLFFRLEADSDFPLGKSLLYGAYTAWKTKKILQEYECIGVAKNLSGVLDIAVPSEYMTKYLSEPNSAEALYVDNLLQQAEMLHAGKGSYILRASDTTQNGVKMFDISTIGGSGGQQSYDVGKAIARYNQEIQLSLQTMVLSLGADGGGSFALSDNSTHLMTLFIENIRSTIASEMSKAVKAAWFANGFKIDSLPVFTWEDIEPVDWDEFTKGWQRLLQSGGVTPTEELEDYLRKAGDAPEADYTKRIYNETNVDESERLDDGKNG